MKNTSTRLGLLFVLLAFLWGGSFVAIKEAIAVFDSWFSATFRLIVATSVLLILFWFQKTPLKLPFSLAWKIWVTGLFTMGIPFSLLFWGEKYVSAGLAGMTNGTTPLWTALLAASVSVQERSSLKSKGMLAGLGLGFVGIVLLFLPLVSGNDLQQIHGGLAILGMAICYAVGNVLNKFFFSGHPSLSVKKSAIHQHASSLVFLGIGSLLFGQWTENFDFSTQWMAVLAILYLGCFSTAFALLIYFFLLKEWGAVKTSAVTYLVPVFAVMLDLLFLGTKPSVLSLVGIGLVLLGVFFIRTSKKLPSPPNEEYSDQNKRDAQKLTHAKR